MLYKPSLNDVLRTSHAMLCTAHQNQEDAPALSGLLCQLVPHYLYVHFAMHTVCTIQYISVLYLLCRFPKDCCCLCIVICQACSLRINTLTSWLQDDKGCEELLVYGAKHVLCALLPSCLFCRITMYARSCWCTLPRRRQLSGMPAGGPSRWSVTSMTPSCAVAAPSPQVGLASPLYSQHILNIEYILYSEYSECGPASQHPLVSFSVGHASCVGKASVLTS